jgi:hypothetical protein
LFGKIYGVRCPRRNPIRSKLPLAGARRVRGWFTDGAVLFVPDAPFRLPRERSRSRFRFSARHSKRITSAEFEAAQTCPLGLSRWASGARNLMKIGWRILRDASSRYVCAHCWVRSNRARTCRQTPSARMRHQTTTARRKVESQPRGSWQQSRAEPREQPIRSGHWWLTGLLTLAPTIPTPPRRGGESLG